MKVKYASLISTHAFKNPSLGDLVVIEPSTDGVPFVVKRIFFIHKVPHVAIVRARHAHHKVHEALIAIQGSCTVHLDDGQTKETVVLHDPSVGLVIGPRVWRELKNFSKDCILLVLANNKFDPDDYIRDYDEFLKYANKNRKN